MIAVIINPGTEGRDGASLNNAQSIVSVICKEIGFAPSLIEREPQADMKGGFFGFVVKSPSPFIIHVPGDDPSAFFLSHPFTSRRMYVDGSSWFWNYAAVAITRRIKGEDAE